MCTGAQNRHIRARIASDVLSSLPDELKTMVVASATEISSTVPAMETFVAAETARLKVAQALRLVNVAISRLPKTRAMLYDATSSLWAARAALKTAWRPSIDLLELFGTRPRTTEMISYVKEREAYYAMISVSGYSLSATKNYLAFQKRRRKKVADHFKELNVYNPHATEEEDANGDGS